MGASPESGCGYARCVGRVPYVNTGVRVHALESSHQGRCRRADVVQTPARAFAGAAPLARAGRCGAGRIITNRHRAFATHCDDVRGPVVDVGDARSNATPPATRAGTAPYARRQRHLHSRDHPHRHRSVQMHSLARRRLHATAVAFRWRARRAQSGDADGRGCCPTRGTQAIRSLG